MKRLSVPIKRYAASRYAPAAINDRILAKISPTPRFCFNYTLLRLVGQAPASGRMQAPRSFGTGAREASFVLLFGFLGISPAQATAVSFAWFLSVATGSLPGLIEYLRYKKGT